MPLVLASARISERSLGRYRRLGALFTDAVSSAAIVAAQGAGDAARFKALGASPESTHVTGNLKFDFELPAGLAERGRRLRRVYAARRPLWVAGSTHEGEEAAVLEAQRRCAAATRRRWSWSRRGTRRVSRGRGTSRHRGSRLRAPLGRRDAAGAADAEVLLLDCLGELLEFYAAADVAFVGGSLVPVGGHNLLEPAALGVPILTGPHNFNGAEVAQLLIARGAAEIVHNAAGARRARDARCSRTRQRASASGRGARIGGRQPRSPGKLLELIEPLLPSRRQRRRPPWGFGLGGRRRVGAFGRRYGRSHVSGVGTAGEVVGRGGEPVVDLMRAAPVERAGREAQREHAHDVVVAGAANSRSAPAPDFCARSADRPRCACPPRNPPRWP